MLELAGDIGGVEAAELLGSGLALAAGETNLD
jgi:hypothetical protein